MFQIIQHIELHLLDSSAQQYGSKHPSTQANSDGKPNVFAD